MADKPEDLSEETMREIYIGDVAERVQRDREEEERQSRRRAMGYLGAGVIGTVAGYGLGRMSDDDSGRPAAGSPAQVIVKPGYMETEARALTNAATEWASAMARNRAAGRDANADEGLMRARLREPADRLQKQLSQTSPINVSVAISRLLQTIRDTQTKAADPQEKEDQIDGLCSAVDLLKQEMEFKLERLQDRGHEK